MLRRDATFSIVKATLFAIESQRLEVEVYVLDEPSPLLGAFRLLIDKISSKEKDVQYLAGSLVSLDLTYHANSVSLCPRANQPAKQSTTSWIYVPTRRPIPSTAKPSFGRPVVRD